MSHQNKMMHSSRFALVDRRARFLLLLLLLIAIISAGALAGRGAMAQSWSEWYHEYKDYDQIVTRAEALIAARPDLAERVHIGTTYLGEEIFGVRVTDLAGGVKPGMLLNAAQHGTEPASAMTAMYTVEWLVRNHDESQEIKHILDELEFIIVPVFNVDGFLVEQRHNARGVDLNRNWSIGWTEEPTHGSRPFSEPETQAMRDFILARPNLRTHIDIHGSAGMVLEPWGYTYEYPEDHVLLHYVASEQASAMHDLYGRRFEAGTPPDIL